MSNAEVTLKEAEVSLRFSNSRNMAIRFVLEPWGEAYPFGPDDEFLVQIRGPGPGTPEIDLTDEALTVYGWAGSTAKVFKNGEELGAGLFERTRIPKGRKSEV